MALTGDRLFGIAHCFIWN